MPIQEENPTLTDEELRRRVEELNNAEPNARGGSIQARAMGGLVGGMPCMNDGMRCIASAICTPYCTTNAMPNRIMGCASTQYFGGLPTTRS
jgi:hypothetical protein